MEPKRSWWQQIKTHPVITFLISLAIAFFVLVLIGGYKFNWTWTGFNGTDKTDKTLYDWLQLLFIPVVLAVAGFWFNHREQEAAELRAENESIAAGLRAEAEREIEQQRAKTERDIAEDNQHEAALQAYIDKIAELLLEKKLRESKSEDEVRKIARIRTLTTIALLDKKRKQDVLYFLIESGLIDQDTTLIRLSRANLSGAELGYFPLPPKQANPVFSHCIEGTDLSEANLSGANLSEANLTNTELSEVVELEEGREENVNMVDLIGANLTGVIGITVEKLEKQAKLKGATMPDGSKHP
jgi:hypothetical protein